MKSIDDFYDKVIAHPSNDEATISYANEQRHNAKIIIDNLMRLNNPMVLLPFVSLYLCARSMKNNGFSNLKILHPAIDTCDEAIEKMNIEWE